MPYIKRGDRLPFDAVLNQLPALQSKGELEYCIFKLMVRFMCNKEERYSTLHEAVYAAMHCADEFRRRRLDKREDEAMEQNGDVYNYE